MIKKKIARIARASYVANRLDLHRVKVILERLSGQEQREYLRALKRHDRKLYVSIDTSFALSEQNKKIFAELYPKKRVIFRHDPDLLLGVRITEDDMVYNLNMSSVLDQMKIYLNKSL